MASPWSFDPIAHAPILIVALAIVIERLHFRYNVKLDRKFAPAVAVAFKSGDLKMALQASEGFKGSYISRMLHASLQSLSRAPLFPEIRRQDAQRSAEQVLQDSKPISRSLRIRSAFLLCLGAAAVASDYWLRNYLSWPTVLAALACGWAGRSNWTYSRIMQITATEFAAHLDRCVAGKKVGENWVSSAD